MKTSPYNVSLIKHKTRTSSIWEVEFVVSESSGGISENTPG